MYLWGPFVCLDYGLGGVFMGAEWQLAGIPPFKRSMDICLPVIRILANRRKYVKCLILCGYNLIDV